MNKRLIAFSTIPFAIFIAVQLAFNGGQDTDKYVYAVEDLSLNYEFPKTEDLSVTMKDFTATCFQSPVLDKSFVGFKEAVAFKESRGNYASVNTLGYLGKYQFGKETLKLIGVYNTVKFLEEQKLQEKAFVANTMRNKWILRRDIKRFVGKRIDGVLITESGILAAAHLAGPGNVKKYLRSFGALGFTDAYGTSVRNYMKKFSGYDTSFVIPEKKIKVGLL